MSRVRIPNTVLKFNGLTKDLSTTVATALWQKVAEVQEYILASTPVGKVIWFRANQDLLPELPDSRYWQELNGSTVTNPESPLLGVVLPDLRGCFLKHPADGAPLHAFGGSDTRNLAHNHGGQTGVSDPKGDFNADNSDEVTGPFPHSHPISTELPSNLDIRPPYRGLRLFIRIV